MQPNPELLLLLLLEEGEHVLLEWAICQKPEIAQAVLFLIESNLLNSKQSQIIRHGTFSENTVVTVDKVCSLLREKQTDLLGLGEFALRSLSSLKDTNIPLSCSLSSIVEALWMRIAAALDVSDKQAVRRFIRSLEVFRSDGTLQETPKLNLNTVLVSETDMRYFKLFLETSGQDEANLVAQWQLINGLLLKLVALKAKTVDTRMTRSSAGSPAGDKHFAATRTSRSDKFAPSRKHSQYTGTHGATSPALMTPEDAAWSLGCLLNGAKQIRHLAGDLSLTAAVDKQTIDLLVILEKTDFIDETSASCINNLDNVFVLDTVVTLESIFRQYESQIHAMLEKKFKEFSESKLYIDMLCLHRLKCSELVRELLSFQSVLKNVIKTGVLTWTGGFGSTLIHYGPFLSRKDSIGGLSAASYQSTASAVAALYGTSCISSSDLRDSQSSRTCEQEPLLSLEETVDVASPILLARILTLLLSNNSLTLLSTSTKVLQSLVHTLKVLLGPFHLFHQSFYSPASATLSSFSSLEYKVVAADGREALLHEVEDLLVDYEDRRRGNVEGGAESNNPSSPDMYSDFRKMGPDNGTTSAAARFLQPTALLTCLFTGHYSGRGPLIDHTFVIDIDRCQILSNPIGQEAILLTLEPCYLNNLVTRLKLPCAIGKDYNIKSSFKYFLIEAILRFIPGHLIHFPVEQVIGFDVESFFRDIDIDDVKHIYSHKRYDQKKDSSKRALPRSKAFYYAFVDSPYFFNLLIEHGSACNIDFQLFSALSSA